MENLGVPRRSDLAGSSDVVYVHAYKRGDGTEVKAHYRSKHGGIPTGGAASEGKYVNIETAVSNKILLDAGINSIGRMKKQDDAVEFWNVASRGYSAKSSQKYINNNGKMYGSISTLGSEYMPYKGKIQEKVKSQFHKNDVPGIVFHKDSSVANAISKSDELKKFINKNLSDLKKR